MLRQGDNERTMFPSLLFVAALFPAAAAVTAPKLPKPPKPPKKSTPAKPWVRTPSTLDRKIMDVLACASPAIAAGHIGIHAVQLQSRKVLHEQNAQNSFVPGSNAKLISTALALSRLGPPYTFETRLAADAEPGADGALQGNLYWMGGGDPTLASRRFAAFDKSGASPMDAIEEFANAVVAKGIRRINGDIVGDETRFPRDPYPIGWTIDDATADYGAAVSALTLHDNVQALTVSPWQVRAQPAIEYFTIFNHLRTGAESNVHVERVPGSRQLLLSGTLPPDRMKVELIALDDPALFAATILKEELQKRGVRVDGAATVRSRRSGEPQPEPPAVTLYTRQSPPLVELLRVIDKISQNLWAELVLREVARVRTGEGTPQAAIREMTQFLASAGVDPECCFFQDASGLSRQTLLTPQAITRVLSLLYRSENREAWLSLLPIGGVDGSLSKRFDADTENGKRIRAKTGSLAHVTSLSGYAFSRSQGDIAFSILFNNYNGSDAEAHAVLDRIALALAAE